MGVPLFGCNSHRLNKAAEQIYAPYSEILLKLDKLVSKFCTTKYAAKLRTKSELEVVQRQETRWTSTYECLSRYLKVKQHMDHNDPELAPLLLNAQDDLKLQQLHQKLGAVFQVLTF